KLRLIPRRVVRSTSSFGPMLPATSSSKAPCCRVFSVTLVSGWPHVGWAIVGTEAAGSDREESSGGPAHRGGVVHTQCASRVHCGGSGRGAHPPSVRLGGLPTTWP